MHAITLRQGFVFAFLCLVTATAESAAPLTVTDHLRRFFTDVNSYSARFNQVVLDEALNTVQESSGLLWIERPNKFRWEYSTPFKQQIVADGKKVWVYDVELQQATVRPASGALDGTPAMLLAGKGPLDNYFTVKTLETQGAIEWAQLMPKRKDGGFENFRIGFEQGKIRVLEMVDGFGQTTRITLRASQENAKIDPEKFIFTPPPGVDVVGE